MKAIFLAGAALLSTASAAATAPILTVRVETPVQLVARCGEAWGHAQTAIEGGSCPSAREIICAGLEGGPIADDDPALALFEEGALEDRKVALAIERNNSCEDDDRHRFREKQRRLYDILTDAEISGDSVRTDQQKAIARAMGSVWKRP